MLPSQSNPDPSDVSEPLTPCPQVAAVPGMDTEQMFRLIDSILPFEACLYYQFLPLALEGRYLRLGMVSPHDSTALDYVRHILAYLNCSLKTELISADVHQSMLSTYLKTTRTASPSQERSAKYNIDRHKPLTPVVKDVPLAESLPSEGSDNTLTSAPSQQKGQEIRQASQAPDRTPQLQNDLTRQGQPTPKDAFLARAVVPVSKDSPSAQSVPPLGIQALYLSQPIEFIATLPPQQLLQELLGRVLVSGIGRLYFERQPERGRILWSQEGVLQSVLEELPLPVFQGVIVELKRFANLPLLPVMQLKQVEIERRYQQEDLLLRLRVMPGTHGEEVTLQVLRGVALKFYQRQQLEKLSQDALKLAQQLQQKLNEISDRSNRYPAPLEVLPALNQVVQGCDKQLEALSELSSDHCSHNSAC